MSLRFFCCLADHLPTHVHGAAIRRRVVDGSACNGRMRVPACRLRRQGARAAWAVELTLQIAGQHALVCRRCVGDVGQVMWMHWLMVVVGVCSGMCVWDARTAFYPRGATCARSRVCVGAVREPVCFPFVFPSLTVFRRVFFGDAIRRRVVGGSACNGHVCVWVRMSLPACRLRRQGARAARAVELTLQIAGQHTRLCVWWVRWWRRSGDVDALVDGCVVGLCRDMCG